MIKLKEAQTVNKRINKMIAMPISLDQVDKRKQIILTQCDKILKEKYNAHAATTNVITVNANVEALQTLINRFGSVSISCIDAPVLLSVMNDGKNEKVRVRFDAKNPKKRVQMKVKWTLNSEQKEEKEQWNEQRIDNPKSNECTVCVKQCGSYQFKVSLELDDESAHCVESNTKSIAIAQIMPSLTVNRNETKVLQSDAIHRFTDVLVKSNGTLTTTPWNGTNGGKLRLQIQTLVIESNATIDLNGLGYKGGKAKQKEVNGTAFTGESVNSPSECKTNANKGGGGGGSGRYGSGSTGGGGGGYGTKGSDAQPNEYNLSVGKGGDIYGDSKVTNLYLGSGGGSGHPYDRCDGKCGGNGGGALKITAQKIIIKNKGSISCNGHNAPSVNNARRVSGGGGGSGGSIHIKAQNIINNGQIMAKGGKGADEGSGGYCSRGGDGGYGRIRIDTGSLKDIGNVSPNIGYNHESKSSGSKILSFLRF